MQEVFNDQRSKKSTNILTYFTYFLPSFLIRLCSYFSYFLDKGNVSVLILLYLPADFYTVDQ